MKRILALTLAAMVGVPFSLSAAHAQTRASASPAFVYGSPAELQQAERVVAIQPDTRWVNVAQGESVRFVIGATQFGWRFDGRDGRSFDLQSIAPPGALSRSVMVYVERSAGHRP